MQVKIIRKKENLEFYLLSLALDLSCHLQN